MTLALGPAECDAVRLSLRVAIWASLASLPLAIFVAYALARWDFWGKQIVTIAVHLPLVLPPVVTGYLLLISFGARGPIGSALDAYLGITLAFRWTGAALAAAVMAFPLMVMPIRLGFAAIDQRLEQAARSLGAGPVWVFATVSLPLALPGIVTGFIMAFAKAIGEFGATITFVSNIPGQTQTLPSAIHALLQVPNGADAASRLVLIAVAISVLALVASGWIAQRAAQRVAGA